MKAIVTLSLLPLLFSPAGTARAATLCFTETGECVGDPFGAFWEGNGGLPVFGFPIAAMVPEANPDTGQTYLTQWLERERLESHPELQPPYTILLGRLGVERLAQLGRDWRSFPKAAPGTPHYFAVTGHAIAPQFWDHWRGHGLELGDAGGSEREALALFGYPLSEPAMERNQAGDMVLTQWFERARFEYHPDNPAPYTVLLGLLGQEVRSAGRPMSSPFYEDRIGAIQALLSYYNAINWKEYQRAYSYWERPGTSPTSTPPDFATFVQGYAETAYVELTAGTPMYDAGAGNFWATVPVVIRASTTGGGRQVFVGCYVLHHTSPGADPRPDAALWKLNRAQIMVERSEATPAALLPGLRCDPGTIPPPEDVQEQVVTLRVADAEEYRIRLTDPEDIAVARRLLAGEEAPGIPHGRVVRGDPDVNVGYSWHIDPASLEFVDATIEVCDGRPSDVERGLITSDRYCPWSARVIRMQPLASAP